METYERNKLILKMYSEGASITKLSLFAGITEDSVKHILRDAKKTRQGLKADAKFTPTDAVLKRQASQRRDQIIAQEYRSGEAVKCLARKYDLPESTIYSAIKRVRESQ